VIGLSNRKCIDHRGRLFSTVRDMCTFHNISLQTYTRRLKRGYTLEQALTGEGVKRDTPYKYYDHEGNGFTSLKDMCNYRGVTTCSYQALRKQGYTLEQALSDNTGLAKHTDHNGRVFDTVSAMCKYHGITNAIYYHRLKRGFTLEQALTGKDTKKDICYNHYDHEGNGFTTLKEMCAYHGVTLYGYKARLKQGCTLEQALTNNTDLAKRTDHNGVVFDTVDAMCRHHNVVKATYYLRLQKGYTKEQALTPRDTYHCDDFDFDSNGYIDHLGRKFKTKKEMCIFHGVSVVTYCDRIQKGYTREEALTITDTRCCTDHNGKQFDSAKAMCEYHGVLLSTYASRLRRGYTKEQALTGKKPNKINN